jgi:signal transduction histidine kinase
MTFSAQPLLPGRTRRGQWQLLDYLAAGGYALLLTPLLAKYAAGPLAPLIVLGGLVAFAAPIAVRRRRPLLALGLVVAGVAVTLTVEPRVYAAAIAPLALVSYLGATGPRRTALVVLGISLASAAAAGLPDFTQLGATALSGLCYLTVWTIGFAVGLQRRYTADLLRHQAREAEAELARARREVTEERLRIARELHDVIAHSMSVVTVQAGFGALVIDTQPAAARDALDAIARTGRQTLTELRVLLGVLRSDGPHEAAEPGHLEPSPSLAQLDQLVADTSRAGLQVQVTVPDDRTPLPAGVELAAYRVVQEALTNVVRHAGTSQARVLIAQDDAELVVQITDAGTGTTPTPSAGGHGLIGMRERVHAYGGTLQAAPVPGAGFCVLARFPLPTQAPRPQTTHAA